MHRALEILDIVCIIAGYLRDGDLKSMALVQKLFWRPCMAIVWRNLEGLERLLRLLPSHLIFETPLGYDSETTVTEYLRDWPLPKKSDWQQYNRYAQFVRTLEIRVGSFSSSSVDNQTFRNLVIYYPTRPLFPYLHYLNLEVTTDAQLAWSISCLTDCLHRFTLVFEEKVSVPALSSYLALLPDSAPHLTSLRVEGRALCSGDAYVQLAETVSSLKKLSEATFWFATNVQVDGEGDLSFPAYDDLVLTDVRPIAKELTVLEVLGPPQFCEDILRHSSFPRLQELRLQLYEPSASRSFRRLIRAIVQSSPSLHTLEIRVPSTEDTSVELTDCAPLLQSRLLRYVELRGLANNWQAAHIGALAVRWEALRRLQLNEMTRAVLLVHLLPVAEHCRNLHYMSVPVNLEAFIMPAKLCAPALSLRHLYFGSKSCYDGNSNGSVTAFIMALWPNVQLYYRASYDFILQQILHSDDEEEFVPMKEPLEELCIAYNKSRSVESAEA